MSRSQISSEQAAAILDSAVDSGRVIEAFQNGLYKYDAMDASEFLVLLAKDLSAIQESALTLIVDTYEKAYRCAMWECLDILLAAGSIEGHEHCALAADDFANIAVKLGCLDAREVKVIRDDFQRDGTSIDELAGAEGAALLSGDALCTS